MDVQQLAISTLQDQLRAAREELTIGSVEREELSNRLVRQDVPIRHKTNGKLESGVELIPLKDKVHTFELIFLLYIKLNLTRNVMVHDMDTWWW